MNTSFDKFSGTTRYITSPALRQAVNIAVALRRPLLIKGEPGTGKTLLATAVAEDLGQTLLTWNVKSTSKAQDGLYVYDTVQRLQDSRFSDRNVSDIRQYIRLGALGQALTSQEQVVLLIDEIDKADLEFPNDLLHELDAMKFTVTETGDVHTAQQRPVVIITSNAEKELPDPFLRRCIFYFIDFPEPPLMRRILDVHHPNLDAKLLDQVLVKFYWLREQKDLRKKPSTSELIDWLYVLMRSGVEPTEVQRALPFLGTLIKQEQDQDTLARAAGGGKGRNWI